LNERLKKLVSLLKEQRIDALLVTKDVNIRYLTDFPAADSWLLVSPKKTYYITDFRYILEAKKSLKGIGVERCTKSLSETVAKLSGALRVKRLGFDERFLPVLYFKKLKSCCGSRIKLVSANGLVESLREVKTPEEISRIRKAIKVNLEAFEFLKGVIRPGLSERSILDALESFVKGKGATFSFAPIIASGPNSCFPHARISERKIKSDDIVMVDAGVDVDGYKSDLTRVYFLGKIPRLVKQVYIHVQTAQQRAIKKIKAKATACEVDQEARNYLTKNGLGKFFGHSLGHGVGLEIHESPTVSSKSSSVLKEGMIFTVEPAVYLPGKFGIRIEDMVLVTTNGCEVLSGNSPAQNIN